MIQSIQRALAILTLFSYSRPRWGIADMAQALDLARPTIHNIARTLEQGGFLYKDEETRKYSLGPMIFTLGSIMAGTLEINQKASAPAQHLARSTGLICRVAVWDRDAALVTLDIDPQQNDPFSPRIGPRVLAYCSAIGRALLAHMNRHDVEAYLDRCDLAPLTPHTITDRARILEELQRTRDRGYALNNQEISQGRASIAAAVFRSGGKPAASLSLTGHVDRVLGEGLDDLVNNLRDIAAEISRNMGFYPASAGPIRRVASGDLARNTMLP